MWQRILIPASDTQIYTDHFKQAFQNTGFKLYDPFAGGTGAPPGIKERIRTFICPPLNNWIRVATAPQDQIAPDLIQQVASLADTPIVNVHITSENDFTITVYNGGTASREPAALQPFLRPDISPEHLTKAWNGEGLPPAKISESDLPPELQAFAEEKGVNPGMVDKMMKKMNRRIARKLDGDSQDDAKNALKAGQTMSWQNPAALTVLAIMACLTVPAGWREPDWKILTDAYGMARQQQRGSGLLLPGDDAILKALPDALDHTPVFVGKK